MNRAQPKILAIDDTPENLLLLGHALEAEFDLAVATSGSQGMAMAALQQPDLILLDVMMPGMDGYETCRALKGDPHLRDVPVIFLTALSSQDSEATGLELGAVDYITKPFNIEITRQRIRNQLERERLRREVVAHRDHLEELVRQRTLSLSIAKEAAEAADRAKTTLLRNMSHEMRTPLHGILGMISLAKRRSSGPQQTDQLSKAESSAQHLLGQLDALLDMARIEAGRFTLAHVPFTLEEILGSVRQAVLPMAQSKKLTLEVQLPPTIQHLPLEGDPLRLKQVLLDLLNNAIKFTHQGSIQVRVAPVQEAAEQVELRFEVQDSGIGIAPEDLPRIFEPFEQVDGSNTRRYGGMGLGLALGRQLVERMNGQIGVDSTPGQGSTFWFTVRLGTLNESQLPDHPTHPDAEILLRAQFSGSHVLVVDDDPLTQTLVEMVLDGAGLQVQTASDGAQALALARSERYDLVLMDIRMPGDSGIATTYTLRTLPDYAGVPILAISSTPLTEEREECLRAGMNGYLPKPLTPEQLLDAVLDWLMRAKSGH